MPTQRDSATTATDGPAPPVAEAERRPVLHVFSNFVPSGPELRAIRLMEAFRDRFRHSVLSMDGRTDAVEHLPDQDLVRLLGSLPKAGTLATARRLRRVLREERPHLVLTYGWGAFDTLVAAGSLGFRALVHHEDGFNADEAARFKRRRIWARRLMLPIAHRVVVPSRRLQTISTELWRLPRERVCLIPNGIPVESSAVADGDPALRQRLGIPIEVPLVGSLGHLRAEKNFRRLVDAVAATDPGLNLHLLLIGEGPERVTLKAHADAAGLSARVHLVGHKADPARFLRALDVYALSSDTEQMPISLLEAMASGLAVVATDVGDVRDMLPEVQHRFLVSPRGPNPAGAMTANLASLLGDRLLRHRLGAANRDQVRRHYGFEQMARRYLSVYESALSARRP